VTDPGPPLPPQTDSAATGRPLFRPEVLAAKSDFLGQIIIARPPGVLLYTLVAAAALAMFVTALLVIQVPNVRAFPGWVEPSGSQLRVEAPTTGSISRVLMSQGSQATSGQPLVELSTERTLASGPDVSAVILQSLRVQKRQLEDRMRLVAETYDGQRRELEAQKAGLGAQLASGSQQLALAQQRLVLAERQVVALRGGTSSNRWAIVLANLLVAGFFATAWPLLPSPQVAAGFMIFATLAAVSVWSCGRPASP